MKNFNIGDRLQFIKRKLYVMEGIQISFPLKEGFVYQCIKVWPKGTRIKLGDGGSTILSQNSVMLAGIDCTLPSDWFRKVNDGRAHENIIFKVPENAK